MICLQCLSDHDQPACPYCGHTAPKPSQTDPKTKGSESHDDLLQQGTILLERYEVGKILGAGGFGITYLANHTKTGLPVAIKEYFPVGSRRKKNKVGKPARMTAEQFQHGLEAHLTEGYILGRIRHPSIVQVHEAFGTLGTAYVVMTLVQGQTLSQRLSEHGDSISVHEAAQYAIQLLKGLEQLHAHKVIHRDIKPENIIISGNRAVLIDFGAAREFNPQGTEAMSRIYTHGYAPPEQYDAKGRFGVEVDLYALSATLHHILLGSPPETSTLRENAIKMPEHLVKRFPGLCSAIEQGLNLNPLKRPK
jgi:serine/threonine protein kinase